jgi:hypothetical protein
MLVAVRNIEEINSQNIYHIVMRETIPSFSLDTRKVSVEEIMPVIFNSTICF